MRLNLLILETTKGAFTQRCVEKCGVGVAGTRGGSQLMGAHTNTLSPYNNHLDDPLSKCSAIGVRTPNTPITDAYLSSTTTNNFYCFDKQRTGFVRLKTLTI